MVWTASSRRGPDLHAKPLKFAFKHSSYCNIGIFRCYMEQPEYQHTSVELKCWSSARTSYATIDSCIEKDLLWDATRNPTWESLKKSRRQLPQDRPLWAWSISKAEEIKSNWNLTRCLGRHHCSSSSLHAGSKIFIFIFLNIFSATSKSGSSGSAAVRLTTWTRLNIKFQHLIFSSLLLGPCNDIDWLLWQKFDFSTDYGPFARDETRSRFVSRCTPNETELSSS